MESRGPAAVSVAGPGFPLLAGRQKLLPWRQRASASGKQVGA